MSMSSTVSISPRVFRSGHRGLSRAALTAVGTLGVEARPARWLAGRAVSFSPFVGAGVGARSDNYRKLEADATHNLAGYGAAGGKFGIGRVGLRLEVRDYATGFKPLVGAGTSDTRNDVVIMAGLRFNRHRASQQ